MKYLVIVSILVWGAFSSAATFNYAGKFDGVSGVLVLEQVNQTYRANFTGNNGQRGLLAGCESSIGKVQKYKEKNGVLKQIIFAFDPNQCMTVEGRSVIMDFKDSKVTVSVLSHIEVYQGPCYPDWQGHQNCPFPERRPVYFSGQFIRQ